MIHVLVLEHPHDSRVVNPWNHDGQQIIDEEWRFREVESESLRQGTFSMEVFTEAAS